jgi:hypothetical protein
MPGANNDACRPPRSTRRTTCAPPPRRPRPHRRQCLRTPQQLLRWPRASRRDEGGGRGQHLVAAAAAAAGEGRDVPVRENIIEHLFYFFLCVNFLVLCSNTKHRVIPIYLVILRVILLEGNLPKPGSPYCGPTDDQQLTAEELKYSRNKARRSRCPTNNLLEVWQNLELGPLRWQTDQRHR